MTRMTLKGIVSFAVLVAAAPCYAQSPEQKCPEGRTFSGSCMNPELAGSMRKAAVVNTQPKISKTSPIYPPLQDRMYSLPYDYLELVRLFGQSP
jgi:hypothetical protein